MFSTDDLTPNEYGILARKIGADPAQALARPDSTVTGAALAGLVWLRDKRAGSTVPFEDYLERTMADLLNELRDPGDPVDTGATPEGHDQGVTARELAQTSADAVTGTTGEVDPTVPPVSRYSGS